MPLVTWTEKGLSCEDGGFYIDPHRSVETAVVTHAHSDHARKGSRRYVCAENGVRLLKARLGDSIEVTGVPFGKSFRLGAVDVSLHSAGHILGSAQVRIQRGGEVWVASGDYKRDPDPSCDPFEPVECDTFITEATFGTPKYRWDKGRRHGKDIHEWWSSQAERGVNCILYGYSLGKAQRILAELEPFAKRPVIIHSSMAKITQCYREEGRKLAPTVEMGELGAKKAFQGELFLIPPSALTDEWEARLGESVTAFASGWMQGTGWSGGPRMSYDHGFVISDHADWDDLNRTIDESRATRVFVQHRENGALVRHLRARGLDAHPATALVRESYERLAPQNLPLFPRSL